MNRRYFELDVLRGSAVVLMLLFHFGYDLAHFGYAAFETTQDLEWILFRGVIVSMFLLSVGMSLYLAYADKIRWDKILKRTGKLLLVSVVISIGSYAVFADQWIYFGVIHFIALASLAALAFLKSPNLALLAGIVIISGYIMGFFHLDPLLDFFINYFNFPRYTVDVVSFTPWFGVVLIGLYVMHKRAFGLRCAVNTFTHKLSFLGRHSLKVYLAQQPVLFSIFYAIEFLR